MTDSDFNRARLIPVGSVVRVKRRYAAAKGCSLHLSCWFRAGSGLGAGGAMVASGARAVTAVHSGELGASTPK